MPRAAPSPSSPSRSTRAATTRPRLALATLTSVLLHALAAALLVAGSGATSSPRHDALLDQAPPDPEVEKPKVTLGSPESSVTSITWVGTDEYKKHIAEKSTLDQPELSQDDPAGQPTPQVARAETQRPEPQPESNADPIKTPIQPASPPALAEAPPSPEPQTQTVPPPPMPARAEILTAPEPDPIAEGPIELKPLIGPVPETPAKTPDSSETPTEKPQPPSEAPPETNPAPRTTPPATPALTGASGTGKKADRESDAASIITAAVKELGQPLIAQGLEIKTVRPRFTYYTQLTAAPRDPIVRLSFDRTGKVHKAEIVKSSGVQDVDRPVLDAAYKWTATGKQLESLAAGNPPETHSIQIRLLIGQ